MICKKEYLKAPEQVAQELTLARYILFMSDTVDEAVTRDTKQMLVEMDFTAYMLERAETEEKVKGYVH